MNAKTDWLQPSARFLVTVAAAMVVIAGLRAAQSFLIPFFLAAFLAIICNPGVRWLNSRKVPLVISIILVVLILVSILTGIGAMIGSSVADLTAALPRYQTRVDQLWVSTIDWLSKQGYQFDAADLRNTFDAGSILRTFGRGLSSVATLASNSFLVFLLLIFMLFEASYLSSKIKAAKGSLRANLGAFNLVSRQVQRYLVLKTLISFITGLIVTIWVSFVGLDFPLV
jgi:predicted PurR-regulated permease PerM